MPDLLPDDFSNGILQALSISLLIDRLRSLFRPYEFNKGRRTDQASGMRGQNAFCTAFHFSEPTHLAAEPEQSSGTLQGRLSGL